MNKVCEVCKKEFVPKNYWQKFCSKKCKVLAWARREMKKMAVIFLLIFICSNAYAYTNTQIANAIFKAENSKTHPYGILTHYKHTTPRQACLNTIAHAKRDWNGKGDFIVFLGNRYCPVGASNDPKGLNKNWVKNVRYFLNEKIN